jgi:hypothetical protein
MAGIVAFVLVSSALTAGAQTLGDVARQEAERRKAVKTGKVYTNDSLKSDGLPAPAAPAPATAATTPAAAVAPPAAAAQPPAAPGGTAAAADDPKTEGYWKKRVTGARDALTRAQTFAEALQTRINVLSADFVNRDDPAQRNVVAADRQKALEELDRVKREITQQTKAIADIQEEARRAGVPAGWVR